MMKSGPLAVTAALKRSLRVSYDSRRHHVTDHIKTSIVTELPVNYRDQPDQPKPSEYELPIPQEIQRKPRNPLLEVPSSDGRRWDEAKPYSHIPQTPTLPILGSGWQFIPYIGIYDFHKRDEANQKKIRRYGRIFREQFNSTEYLICTTMEDLRTIVQAEGPYPIAMELTSVKAYRESRKDKFSTKGLLCTQGEEWFNLRSATQKYILKPSYLRQYVEPIQGVARDFVNLIHRVKDKNDEVPDLLDEIYKWSLECVCLYGLDKRLGCLKQKLPPDAEKVIKAAITLFEMKTKLETFTGSVNFWKTFKTRTWRKFEQASDIYTDITFKYIKESLIESRRNPKNPTVLQAMLQSGDLKVSDATVFVSDLLLAGMDTTSYTAGFLLYHLAKYPQKQRLVYEEVMRLLPTSDVKFTPDTLEDLKYLKACWKESMRLTPIVPARGRVTSTDMVLSGYQIPAGTYVGVIYEPIYMDETIFKDPKVFIPERWLDQTQKPPAYAFQPFGFGFRSCIGKRLAEIQMLTLVAEIIRRYRIDYKYENIGICSKLLNVPDKPLRFTFNIRP